MATPYNPYNANMPMSSPYQQAVAQQHRADRQVAQELRRKKARPEHIQAIAEARKIPRVRVEPTSDVFRRLIKHPSAMAFRKQGSVEWPNDRFTQRRIADGSIRIVQQQPQNDVVEDEKEKQQPRRSSPRE
jgi:hypothetical protein